MTAFTESMLLTERARVETLNEQLHEERLARQNEAKRADDEARENRRLRHDLAEALGRLRAYDFAAQKGAA